MQCSGQVSQCGAGVWLVCGVGVRELSLASFIFEKKKSQIREHCKMIVCPMSEKPNRKLITEIHVYISVYLCICIYLRKRDRESVFRPWGPGDSARGLSACLLFFFRSLSNFENRNRE